MPRVVPSDVVRTIDRMFGGLADRPREFPGLVWEQLPSLAGLVALVDAIPTDLILLPPDDYSALTANLAYLRGVVTQFGGSLPLCLSVATVSGCNIRADAVPKCTIGDERKRGCGGRWYVVFTP